MKVLCKNSVIVNACVMRIVSKTLLLIKCTPYKQFTQKSRTSFIYITRKSMRVVFNSL